MSAGSKFCDGCKKEMDAADESLNIIEDEEDWDDERQEDWAKESRNDTAPQESRDDTAPHPASPVGRPPGGSSGAALLSDAYKHAGAAQHLLADLEPESPQPAMSRVEAAARMAAVKDLLRSELDQLSQAVERLDSLQEGDLDLGAAQARVAALPSSRGKVGPGGTCAAPPAPGAHRGFTRSTQYGQVWNVTVEYWSM